MQTEVQRLAGRIWAAFKSSKALFASAKKSGTDVQQSAPVVQTGQPIAQGLQRQEAQFGAHSPPGSVVQAADSEGAYNMQYL